MKTSLVLASAAVVLLSSSVAFQNDAISRKQLREMLTQLGYEVKDLDTTAGKEKFSFSIAQGGLNIPVAAEISSNDAFVWLTVNCKVGLPTGEKAIALLRRNAAIQPSQIYISKSDRVMMGLCLENRGISNTNLRQRIEKLVGDVVASKEDWQ